MTYNTKNYTEQGGEKTVIGGALEFKEGAKITGINISFTPAAYQANSTASNIYGVLDDFNALLAKLKAAGIMKSSK